MIRVVIYVYQELIAGITGIEKTEDFPNYDSFVLVSRLLRNMQDVHDIDVPLAFQILSDGIGFVESILPLAAPEHIREILWVVVSAFGEEAILLHDEINSLVWHETVEQTWRSPRPLPDIPLVPNVVEGFVMDLIFDLLDRIFDADTHFMMNFYEHLATQAMSSTR